MRILAISDLHGDLNAARRAVERFAPELIVCCGDWGDPNEVDASAFADIIAMAPVYSTFGNHDPIEVLRDATNHDGTPVLIPQGEARDFQGLRFAAIGGIWAKSHKQPYYVTDADVAEAAVRIARSGPLDILLTHAPPVGLADLTPSGRHGGNRCFLDANKTIQPRLHLCGHLHVPQERTLRDGRQIINVGATPEGSVVTIAFDPETRALDTRLERFDGS